MRIAVLGAGYAGLAVTWYLLHYSQGAISIDVFDPEAVGKGASGLSSGLLHAYGGKHARLNWEAGRGIVETHRLITEASRAIQKPIVISKGILRPALTEQQIHDFQGTARSHTDTVWWDKKKCENTIEGLRLPENGGGLYIPEGLTLDSQAYLQGLWQASALHGTQFYQLSLLKEGDLEKYDRVLIAIGPLTKNFPPLKNLPISAVKGQMLELKWPQGLTPPAHSLVSQKYLVMSPDRKTCLVGATFEHKFDSLKPNPELAAKEIMPNITEYFPALADAEVVGCRTGFRATSPTHLPIVGKISDKIYFFTALGSKGLLYHAWLGKRVARAMLSSKTKHFPPEVYYQLDNTQEQN